MAFPSLSIGDLTAKMPIVQGGMGVGISLSGLASAVANQGGIGVIAGAMIGMKEPDVAKNPIEANLRALRQELSKAREKTQGIIGVNIMVALSNFADMVRTAIEEKADIIFSGAGNYAYAAFVGDGRGEARERDAHAHAPLDDRERDFQIAYLNAFHLVVRVFICGNMRFMYREKTVPRHLRRVASERFRACRQFHVE